MPVVGWLGGIDHDRRLTAGWKILGRFGNSIDTSSFTPRRNDRFKFGHNRKKGEYDTRC